MKKYPKNKNFNTFLTKILYILLNIINITPGTKVPKFANFGTKWNYLGHFGTLLGLNLNSFYTFFTLFTVLFYFYLSTANNNVRKNKKIIIDNDNNIF